MKQLNISLAQWSLHRTFFGSSITDWNEFSRTLQTNPDALLEGKDPIDFPFIAAEYGFDTIELVNTFYLTKVFDFSYWEQFKKNCRIANVKVGLIMCDALGKLGDTDPIKRNVSIISYMHWINVATILGAKSVRVNANGDGSSVELADVMFKSLTELAEYAQLKNINILVENHDGYSRDASWLAELIAKVNKANVGTLPDFGNFARPWSNDIIYKGVEVLMTFAKGVSAKSYAFDEAGNETSIDYNRMLKIIKKSGYSGDIGIEYEGEGLSEEEGILKTKLLLEKAIGETI